MVSTYGNNMVITSDPAAFWASGLHLAVRHTLIAQKKGENTHRIGRKMNSFITRGNSEYSRVTAKLDSIKINQCINQKEATICVASLYLR